MPTYVVLVKWTKEGLQHIKESPARLDAGRKAYEAAGVKMKDFYMLLGHYDMLTVAEAPNDEAMAKANLAVVSKGAIQTETLRAFTEEEYKKLFSALK